METNHLYRVDFDPTPDPILSQMIPNIPILVPQDTFYYYFPISIKYLKRTSSFMFFAQNRLGLSVLSHKCHVLSRCHPNVCYKIFFLNQTPATRFAVCWRGGGKKYWKSLLFTSSSIYKRSPKMLCRPIV